MFAVDDDPVSMESAWREAERRGNGPLRSLRKHLLRQSRSAPVDKELWQLFTLACTVIDERSAAVINMFVTPMLAAMGGLDTEFGTLTETALQVAIDAPQLSRLFNFVNECVSSWQSTDELDDVQIICDAMLRCVISSAKTDWSVAAAGCASITSLLERSRLPRDTLNMSLLSRFLGHCIDALATIHGVEAYRCWWLLTQSLAVHDLYLRSLDRIVACPIDAQPVSLVAHVAADIVSMCGAEHIALHRPRAIAAIVSKLCSSERVLAAICRSTNWRWLTEDERLLVLSSLAQSTTAFSECDLSVEELTASSGNALRGLSKKISSSLEAPTSTHLSLHTVPNVFIAAALSLEFPVSIKLLKSIFDATRHRLATILVRGDSGSYESLIDAVQCASRCIHSVATAADKMTTMMMNHVKETCEDRLPAAILLASSLLAATNKLRLDALGKQCALFVSLIDLCSAYHRLVSPEASKNLRTQLLRSLTSETGPTSVGSQFIECHAARLALATRVSLLPQTDIPSWAVAVKSAWGVGALGQEISWKVLPSLCSLLETPRRPADASDTTCRFALVFLAHLGMATGDVDERWRDGGLDVDILMRSNAGNQFLTCVLRIQNFIRPQRRN
jgi:hypothetical protein